MTIDPNFGEPPPGLVDRVKNILLQPQTEWDRIKGEPADISRLYMGYILPLAALASICMVAGLILFRWGAMSPVQAVISGLFQFAMAFVCVYLTGIIINALAPSFGSTQDQGQAHKVAVYSATAWLLAGVFSIHPSLSMLGLLGLYGFVLMFIGLPRLMNTPEDKRVGYFATIVVVTIVVFLVLGSVVGSVRAMVFGLTGGMGGFQAGQASTAPEAPREITLPGGGTIDVAALEKQAQSYSRSGGAAAVDPTRLQAQLPQTLPGGFRLASTSNSSAMGTAQAEGVYESGDARLTVTVMHMGAMGAIAAMASGANVQENRQDADGYQRTQTIDGRIYNEQVSASAGSASYSVVGRGVVVTASGQGITLDQARAAVETIGVPRLEREFGT